MNVLRFLLLLLIFSSGLLSAQPDAYHSALLVQLQSEANLSGGTWLLPPNEATLVGQRNLYGATSTDLSPTGQDFSRALRVAVDSAWANPWNAGLFWASQQPIQSGDRILGVAWLRLTPGTGDAGRVSLFVEDAVTYAKEIYFTTELTDQWVQYLIPFEAGDDYSSGDLNLGLHLGHQVQQIEVAGVNALNYGATVPLRDLPTRYPANWAGADPQAPWRAAAQARIAQHRRGAMQLTLRDAQGQPLANTPVRVQMLRHHYAFGTAVNPRRLPGNPQHDPSYVQHLLDLDGRGHGFNWVVPENALKWRAWEYRYAGTPAQTAQGLQWLLDQGVQTRGHVLLWPAWKFMPDDLEPQSGNPNFLRSRIMGHLDAVLNDPATRAVVREWDVINEIAHVRDLENALAGQPNYPTGREIYPAVLQQAKVEDPQLISYLNDYEILSGGSETGAAYRLFKDFVQEAIDAGGPVDGIGMQGHMGTNLVSPDTLYAILEDCHQAFGLPIKITEYDLDGIFDDSLEARYLHDFLTLVFSHPATNGFLMWGFWDGAHWRENAPLFYQDWTPKPALATFNQLVFDTWWTDTTLSTDARGRVEVDGFYGDYRIRTQGSEPDLEVEWNFTEPTDTVLQLNVTSRRLSPTDTWRAYPNPFQDELHLQPPGPGEWHLRLSDLTGRLWQEARVQGSTIWNTSDLPGGVYLLSLSHASGRGAQRLVVKRP